MAGSSQDDWVLDSLDKYISAILPMNEHRPVFIVYTMYFFAGMKDCTCLSYQSPHCAWNGVVTVQVSDLPTYRRTKSLHTNPQPSTWLAILKRDVMSS